jgi:Ni/Co efflux regulator RcnB
MKWTTLLKTTLVASIVVGLSMALAGCMEGHDDSPAYHHGNWDHQDNHHVDQHYDQQDQHHDDHHDDHQNNTFGNH